jgi:hypothetical protein
MNESYPSPFFSDRRGISQGVSSLVQAFMPNPMREARTGALMSQMDYDRARTDNVRAERAAAQAMGDYAAAAGPGALVDPSTLVNILAAGMRGGNPQILAALPGLMRGFGGAVGAAPDRMAQLQQGAGQDWISTEVGRRFQEDNNLAQAFGVADRNNAGALARERVQQEGADRRMAPEINPGNVVVVPPNSPLAPRATDGRIAGPPVPVTGAAARQAPAVPASTARQFDEYFASPITLNPNDSARTPDPEARRWLSRRAAELWQSGPDGVRGNPNAAIEEALAEFRNAGPGETGSLVTGRGFALPPSLQRPRDTGGPSNLPPAPTEGAATGYRMPNGRVLPENAVIRQNGREFIVRGGVPVPVQ